MARKRLGSVGCDEVVERSRVRRSTAPRFGRALAGLAGAIAIVGTLLLPAVAANAEPPFRVPTAITDRAGALSGSDQADVQAALDKLASEDNVNLFVVYVDTFDNPADSEQWTAQTAQLSSLGSNQILLAIATGGRAYWVNVPSDIGLSSSQLQQIATSEIQPQLADEDWAGAAIAAANGYREALGGSSSTWWWVAGGIVVVGGGGYLIYRRSRSKTDADAPAGVGPDGQPAEPLEPLDQLSERSVQALIDTDNAVRASEFELNAAEAEFGHDAVAHFRTAFDAARESLTAAFEIRQRVDDEVPEDDAAKRAMMSEILSRCADASTKLEAESERFDQLRDLRSRLPQVLAELPGSISAQQTRIPAVAATLVRLQQQYAPSALANVSANVTQATERLAFADSSARQAEQLVGAGTAGPTATQPLPAQPAGVLVNPGTPAVLAAGAAQEAVAQAQTLLDAVEHADTDLAAAVGQLGAACSAVDQELVAVRGTLSSARAGATETSLRAQLDQIQAILGVARSPQGAADPLTALHKVEEADLALDTILATTRDAQQQEKRAEAGLAQALAAARAEVGSAQDFITTRRGAVKSQARTRLAEAQRHLANAESLAGTDAAAGLAEAQQASSLAREASDLAQQDVGGWGGGGGNQRGGGLNGAVLGGIILSSVLNSGRSGRGGGGWGGGGFGGGGFGGGFGGGSSGGGGGGGRSSGGGGRF